MSENNMPQSEPGFERGSDAGHPGGFLAGLLLGGLVGAGAMMLLAPQSGRRTRARIQLKSSELLDQANEIVEDAMAQAGLKGLRIRASVRKEADHVQKSGQDMLDEQMQRVSEVVEAGKSAIQGS